MTHPQMPMGGVATGSRYNSKTSYGCFTLNHKKKEKYNTSSPVRSRQGEGVGKARVAPTECSSRTGVAYPSTLQGGKLVRVRRKQAASEGAQGHQALTTDA